MIRRVRNSIPLSISTIPSWGARPKQECASSSTRSFKNSAVRAIIVNFTTCGLRLDQIARSLVTVLDERRGRLDRPVFVHLQGNRASLGQRIVGDAGYEVVEALGDAVRKAVHAVKEAPR